MENLRFINKNSFLRTISGYILIINGIIFLLIYSFLGLFFIISGLWLLVKTGVEINIENKKYRYLYKLFGISVGSWEKLPKIEYISVFKVHLKYKAGLSLSIEHEFKDSMYRIILFYNTNQTINVFETKNIKEAFKHAKFLAQFLSVDVLDATQKKSKWLD